MLNPRFPNPFLPSSSMIPSYNNSFQSDASKQPVNPTQNGLRSIRPRPTVRDPHFAEAGFRSDYPCPVQFQFAGNGAFLPQGGIEVMRPRFEELGLSNANAGTDPSLVQCQQLQGSMSFTGYNAMPQFYYSQTTQWQAPPYVQANFSQQNFMRDQNVNQVAQNQLENQTVSRAPLLNYSGSFQELLRTVSAKNVLTYQGGCLQNCADVNKDVDGNGNSSVEDSDEEETDEDTDTVQEEEHHDADDEDESDCIIDKNAGMQGRHTAGDEISLQFEIYPFQQGQAEKIKKRRRFPKGYVVPDYRNPSEIGTIEKAMRNAPNRQTKYIFEPIIGMVFDSRAEVYNFYNLYSWEVGFGIRFGTFASNRVNKMRTMQELVCEKEGYDKRCKKSSKRNHCKAMIRLHRTEDLGWYVSKHVSEHNHALSVSFGEKREWNSHSRIEDCTKRIIRYLRDNKVSLSSVHCILGSMYGSMQAVPFNQKSLRAVCSSIARDQKDDDISKTFEVFRELRSEDPGFQFSVDLDSDNKVKTLIWTSGRSRSQYNFFGDAITFDTTYCTNIYKMPFGMFVGVNNHFQSVLFAGVLMTSEDTESFKWVFNEFLTLMGGKTPVTILTDQCKAMSKAIKLVFPGSTTHLWCKWHVLRYAPEELGTVYRRNGPFRRDFHFVINQMLTVDEFERAWEYLLDTYNLRENEFMIKTYKKRHMWAKPWARDTFCARMASTQRSESANSFLKKVVPRHSSMNQFVMQYNKLLFLRTRAEQKAEHETKQFVHRTKRMEPIEKHAIQVYTKNCFKLFSEEVDKGTDYDVSEAEEEDTYIVIHHNAETRKHWARVVFTVKVEDNGERYNCECGQYNHFGILCCHAIKVMTHCHVKQIPKAHIMKRWTRDARDYEYPDDVSKTAGEQLGQSLLYANALDVVKSTNNNPQAGQILTKYLTMARKEIDGLDIQNEKQICLDNATDTDAYISGSGTEYAITDQSGYDSDGQPINRNVYGASGSSAYMSDADVTKIRAPNVPETIGRPRIKRHKPLFERIRKSRKRYSANSVSNSVGVKGKEDDFSAGNIFYSNSLEGLNKKMKKPTKTSKVK